VSLCDALIAEFEASLSPEELDALATIETQVAEYGFPLSPPPPYNEISTIEPTSPTELYRMYGILGLMEGKLGAAIWASAKGLRERPRDADALHQLGALLIQKKRFADARSLLEKARHEDANNDALIRVSLASAEEGLGNLEAASKAYSEAATLEPQSGVTERAERGFYLRVMADVLTFENAYQVMCSDDITEALNLTTQAQLNGFTLNKSTELQQLAMEGIALFQGMPSDLPTDFATEISDLFDAFQAKARATYDDPATQAQSDMMEANAADTQIFFENEAECCIQAGGRCCGCLATLCTDLTTLAMNKALPASFSAIAEYLPGRWRLLERHETDVQRLLFRTSARVSQSTLEWEARYAYNLLAQDCKNVALQVANLLQGFLSAQENAALNCQLPGECWSAEREAQLEEARLRMEEERRRQAEEELRRALAKQQVQDISFNFQLCVPGLFCFGAQGSQVAFTFSQGPAFLQFTADLDSFDVGVRAGIGIGDPSGNLKGMDMSLGVTVGSGGPSFDIQASESSYFGTRGKSINLFKWSP